MDRIWWVRSEDVSRGINRGVGRWRMSEGMNGWMDG